MKPADQDPYFFIHRINSYHYNEGTGLGLEAHSIACPTADPGVASLILAWSHTFVKIDHEIFSIFG